MKFIELHGYFTNDDIDYEALGLPTPDVDSTEELRTMINVDNITEINETDKGTTIEFVSGGRYLFSENYEYVKSLIEGL